MAFDAMARDDDDRLIAAYAAGDAAAAQVLSARLVPRIYAHASRMLGGDRAEAEDVAQDAMLRLWRVAPGWQAEGASVTTWLYRVTSNLCIDRLRKRRSGPALDDVDEPVSDAPSAEAQLLTQSRADALQMALMDLPERQRQAVILRHIDGLSNPEIGQIMDIGPRAVESLTARGKKALEAILTGRRAELGYQDDD